MYAVIFEFTPAPGRQEDYLARAAQLRAALQDMPGFISVERFESISTPGKLVSLSFWESEEAIAGWRNHQDHRESQRAGRRGIFADYRLRVARIVRDYSMGERDQAPPEPASGRSR